MSPDHFPRAHRPAPSMDIWDALGDTHVILALTPEECVAILDDAQTEEGFWTETMAAAREQIRLGLRDQKGIDHA